MSSKVLSISCNDYPLNIFSICRERTNNVEILSVPFTSDKLRGMVSLAPSKNENHVILVNEKKNFDEHNYYGFHEFSHIITEYRPGTTISCFDKVSPNQDRYRIRSYAAFFTLLAIIGIIISVISMMNVLRLL